MTRNDPDAAFKPRKSPRQARSAATVEALLEAAARILETRGLAGYTTNAVAERAGVGIGSLYQYFPGKQALTGALIRREGAALLAEAEAAAWVPGGREALRRLIAAAVSHQLKRPVLARLLDFEEARLPVDPDMHGVRSRLLALLTEILTRPDLPPQADIATAAADLAGLARGLIDAAGERGETDGAGLCRRVERAVFGYLSQAESTMSEASRLC